MEMTLSEICSAVNGKILSGAERLLLKSVSTDSRKDMKDALFIPLKGENFDGHEFIEEAFGKGAAACLIEKKSPVKRNAVELLKDKALVEVESTLSALGDLACWWRKRFKTKIAAVTGSNGKTSTKEIVWNILRQTSICLKNQGNQNNLIGLPMGLFNLSKEHEAAVFELGTNQKGEIRRLAEICSPQIGLITNIGPSHLEGLNSLNDIMEEKAELFKSLPLNGTAVINRDDRLVLKVSERTKAEKIFFGFEKGDIRASDIKEDKTGKTLFKLHVLDKQRDVVLQIPGRHFVSNALAATAVCSVFGSDIETIGRGLETFKPVPGRMELMDIKGVKIINDSYNANPASMYAALKTLASFQTTGKRVAVLGDMLELGEDSVLFHLQLGQTVADMKIDILFSTGHYSETVRSGALSGGMLENNIFVSGDLASLSDMLKEKISSGDTVLLKGSRRMRVERVMEMLG